MRGALRARPSLINSSSKEKFTALHYATISDEIDVVRLLLKEGADVNAVNVHGSAPLDHAHTYTRHEIATMLRAR